MTLPFLQTSGGIIGSRNDAKIGRQLAPTRAPTANTTLSREQVDNLSMSIFNQTNEENVGVSAWEQAGRYVGAVGVDTVDSIWSSPINPARLITDVERGDIWSNMTGEQRLFYERNKPAIEGGSAVVGGIASAVFAEMVAGPRIVNALARHTALPSTRIWQASSKWKRDSFASLLAAQKDAIRMNRSLTFGEVMGTTSLAMNRATVGALNVTRTLPFDYAVMWNNEAFNSGNIVEEAFWVATGGVLGAAAGVLTSRAIARRSMNKPWARSEIAVQNSMAGASNMLLDSAFLTTKMPTRVGNKPNNDVLMTKDSTQVSINLVGSRANLPDGLDAPHRVREEADGMRASFLDQAVLGTEKILKRGMTGIKSTVRAPVEQLPEIKHMLHETAKTDPNVILGLDEMAIPDMPIKTALKERENYIKELYENAQKPDVPSPDAIRDARLAAKMRRQEVFAYLDGTWYDAESPIVEAARKHSDVEIDKRTLVEGDSAVYTAPRTTSDAEATSFVIDPFFRVSKKGKLIDPAKLSWEEKFALDRVTSRLISRRAKSKDKTVTTLSDAKATDWRALDAMDDLMDVAPNLIRFANDNKIIRSRADLRRHSLRLKANAVLKEAGPAGAITEEMRLKYNLPAPTAMEQLEDPHGDAMRVWLEGAKSMDGTSKEMGKAWSLAKATHGYDLLPTEEDTILPIKGKGFNFNRYEAAKGRGQQFMRPVLGSFEPKDVMTEIARNGHHERLMIEKAATMRLLTNPDRSRHVATIGRTLADSPATALAHRVNELRDGQTTGIGSRIGQALSEFLPTRFKYRDSPIIQGSSRLFEQVDRLARVSYTEAVQRSGLDSALQKYSTSSGAGLRAELDQFVSFRPGFDIADAVWDSRQERWYFPLDDTPTNRMLTGFDEIAEDDVLTNPRTGNPITLSDEAMKAMRAYWNSISDELYRGTNVIREANNQSPIARKPFHVPAVGTKDKRVGFIQGPDGQIVPGVAIVEATEQGFNREAERILEEFGDGYTVKRKEAIAATRDIWDIEALDWMDHGTSTALRGARQKGGLTPGFVRDGAFMEMLEQAQSMYRTQGMDTLKTIMRQPLQIARMKSAVARQMESAKPRNQAGKGISKPTRNIFDEYEQALLGSSVSHKETALLSEMADAIADGIDSTVFVPINHIADIATRWGVNPTAMRKAKTHKQIVKALGEHSPYRDADEWLASQGIHKPANLRSTSQKLNELATNLVLRWDPAMAHASLNMLGLIPTVLGNVKAGAAPATMALQVKGKSVPMVDGIAIIKGAMADMFQARRGKGGELINEDWRMMIRNGDASQSSMEYHIMTGQVKSKSEFGQYADKLDKWLAWASDGSENLSRQIAHFTGLRVARYQGIKDMDEAHEFAREFANAAIADYAPSNRPELYQTSLGSVFGLFQSYAINQFTKMFHWMEKGDYAAMGLQAATQATLFGIPGTYGASFVMGAHDKFFQDSGEPSLLDRMYNQFGPTIGNALAHGGIAELTQVALWTRGDMEPRMPIVSGMAPPGIDIIKRFTKGITGSIAPFLNRLPSEAVPAAIENIQREMPNRMLKGIIGVIQGGYETDRNGNVIHDNQTWLDSIARVAGVRSARQQIELEAFYAGKSDMARDARRRDRLRNRLKVDARRAAQRGVTIDPARYFDDYVASGGNPRSFNSWIKQVIRDAPNPRALDALKNNLETPRSRLDLWRYHGMGAWEPN